jgi:tripartite-type tricarboxylate transporter receptor subunit TctC
MRWVVLAASLIAHSAPGQDYPEPGRRVRHIIPWGAGGATDTAMRGFMQYFEKHLGVPIITENIPGGLSAVGLIRLKTARPDGYTIGTLTYDVLTLAVQGLAPVSWKDFDLVGTVTEHPSALIVSADAFETLEAFRTAARSRRIKVGNVGTGGIWHQHATAMENALDIQLAHIPYEAGSGAQLTALLGGEVDANVASLPASLPYVRDGTLRVLAVMATERDPLVPDVPTFREKGYDIAYGGFRVLAVPATTPEAVRSELERALRAACEDDAFRAWADRAVIGAHFRDGAETKTYLAETAAKVEALMKELELTP